MNVQNEMESRLRKRNIPFAPDPFVVAVVPAERLREELDDDPADVIMFEDELFELEGDERGLEEVIVLLLLEGVDDWLDCGLDVGPDGLLGVAFEEEAGVTTGVEA